LHCISGCCCNVCWNGQFRWPWERTGLSTFSRFEIFVLYMLYLSYIACSCEPVKKLITTLLFEVIWKFGFDRIPLNLNFIEIRMLIYTHTQEWYDFAEHMLFMGSSEFPDENEVCTLCMFWPSFHHLNFMGSSAHLDYQFSQFLLPSHFFYVVLKESIYQLLKCIVVILWEQQTLL
jgi:hypothetical protein